jgi:molybdopterin molybdotransferase
VKAIEMLRTPEEALEEVIAAAEPLRPARLPLARAFGRALAEDVAADIDLPPFDKALMDGYAVRSSDLAGADRRLRIGETVTAGRMPSRPIGPREAAVITTGAPLPPEADCVVMHERTRTEGGGVLIDQDDVRPGQNRLVRGREMRAGEIVVSRGARLTAARIGLLASVGRAEVSVVPCPTVAVVPTGDELVAIDRVPGPGQIRNSNSVMLQACAAEAGAIAETLPIAPDEPGPLRATLEQGLSRDLLLITGGVSAGHLDLVPDALESLGVTRVFHKVRLKPGKPLWFGLGPSRPGRPRTLVFGLPGNPVSSLVCFLLFVKPALARLAGLPLPGSGGVEARLGRGFTQRGDRPTYFPARIIDEAAGDRPSPALTVETLDWAGSADLRSVAAADGFAIFPAGDREFRQGEIVRFLPVR